MRRSPPEEMESPCVEVRLKNGREAVLRTANRAAGLATAAMLLLTCPPQPKALMATLLLQETRSLWLGPVGRGSGSEQGSRASPFPETLTTPGELYQSGRASQNALCKLNCDLKKKKLAGECKSTTSLSSARISFCLPGTQLRGPSQTPHDKSSSSVETLGIPTLNSSGTSSALQDTTAGGRQCRRPQEGESPYPS